jgi:hypothetical protein
MQSSLKQSVRPASVITHLVVTEAASARAAAALLDLLVITHVVIILDWFSKPAKKGLKEASQQTGPVVSTGSRDLVKSSLIQSSLT